MSQPDTVAEGKPPPAESVDHDKREVVATGASDDHAADTSTSPLVPPPSDMEDVPLTDRPSTSKAAADPLPPAVDESRCGVKQGGDGGSEDGGAAQELGSQQVVVVDSRLTVTDHRNIWKFVQITVYVCAFVSSLLAFGPLIQVAEEIDGKCLLYADVDSVASVTTVPAAVPADNVIVAASQEGNGTSATTTSVLPTTITSSDSNSTTTVSPQPVRVVVKEWPSNNVCNYCTYTLVCASIYAFVCCWFYLVCGTSSTAHASGDRPELLVVPSLVLSVLISVVVLVAGILVTQGVDELCLSAHSLPNTSGVPCSDLVSDIVRHDSNEVNDGAFTYDELMIAKITCWICTAFWIAATFLLAIRIFVAGDFPPVIRKGEELAGAEDREVVA